jgi:hypothetical protein
VAIAPATCSCGEPLGLVHETADQDSNGAAVFVGKLVCAAGHSWIDIRAIGEDRPHGKAPKAWQRKDLTMATRSAAFTLVAFRVPPELKTRLQRLADAESNGNNVSAVARRLLTMALNQIDARVDDQA